ncbi:hypothetical protein DSM104299_00685 [Baekduia alba]|uniref:hypothetical protein n=1 Tax=Baekduia alba TaxID=2997333 RepID=UPI002341F4E4|nr:hypothetical protein [Baekduia alba]WCB92004.1 hypothetical protein DSM104299_00685 [Baekduia alba]
MTLLLKDTETKTDAPEGEAPPEAAPATAVCPKCQAPVEPGQDWCLNCGEAQASRRVTLPGKRAAATVLALTTVLVGGAVAASYAALNDGTATGTTPTQLAQAPAPAPAPTAAAPAPTPDPSAAAPSSTLPPDATTDTTPPPAASSSPPASDTPATPTPTPTPSSTGSSSGTATGDDSSSKGTGKDTTADTRTSTTPAETEPVAIKLDASAAALYDPFKRDTAAGDPTKALDGDPGTSFPVTVAPGSQQIGAGLTVDLGEKRGVREVDVTTKTPGFKIEIYATDETDLPPDVLDTRWAHLKDVTGVGTDTDGKEIVSLGSGTSKYRHVLLWFTAPPTDGSTVRISELKILG